MSERVKWLSEADFEASVDIYENIPGGDVAAVDTKTGVVYTAETSAGRGLRRDLRYHLGCDEFAPTAKKARATRKMLRAK